MQNTFRHGSEGLRSSATAPLALPEYQLPVSSAELLAHFERISGRKFHSREDVQAYVSGLQNRTNPATQHWATVKRATLLLLLAFAFLQYYAVDVLEEVSGMQSVNFYLPPSADDNRLYRS